jgi:hypothetical protein
MTIANLLATDYIIGNNGEMISLSDDIVLNENGQEENYYYFTTKKHPQILIQIISKTDECNQKEIIKNLVDKMKLYDTVLSKSDNTIYLEYIVIPDEKNRNQDNENSMVLIIWEICKNNRQYLLTFLLKYKDYLETDIDDLKQFGRTLIKNIKIRDD